MNTRTKILVLKRRDLLTAGLIVILAALFIILAVALFVPSENAKKQNGNVTEEGAQTNESQNVYIPGVYATSLRLGDNAIDIEIVVDADNINSVRLVNISEAIATMYPLIEPSFESLAQQVMDLQGVGGVKYQDENKYTSLLLLSAIEKTLEKAYIDRE